MSRKKRDAQSPAAAASNGGSADPAAPVKKRKKRQSAKQDAAAIKRAENMAAALDFRRQGYTYQQIADELKVVVSTAHKWVHDAIAAIPAEAAEDVRSMMIDRIDNLMTKCAEQLDQTEGVDQGLFDMILKLDERKARLLGVYNIGGSEADAVFRAMGDQMVKAMQADRPVLRIEAGTPVPANPVL